MTALKPYVGPADRQNIAFPWLQIKGGNLFLCATNGHTAAVIELINYQDQVAKQDDGFTYIPKHLFEKASVARYNSERDDNPWQPDFTDENYYGSPPNIWQIIPKGERSWNGDYPRFGANPSYVKDAANLFEKMFGKSDSPTMIMSLGEDANSPILISDNHTNANYRVNVVIMPMRV